MVSSSRPTAALQDWLSTWSAPSAHHLAMTASQLCSRSTKAALPFVVSIVATQFCLAWARHDAMHCAMGMPDVGLPPGTGERSNATISGVHKIALRVQGIACSTSMTNETALLIWPMRSGPECSQRVCGMSVPQPKPAHPCDVQVRRSGADLPSLSLRRCHRHWGRPASKRVPVLLQPWPADDCNGGILSGADDLCSSQVTWIVLSVLAV